MQLLDDHVHHQSACWPTFLQQSAHNTANLGIADPSGMGCPSQCLQFFVMLLPFMPSCRWLNQDLVSHVPDNFSDSFISSIPEDNDDVLTDLAAERDTTHPSDSSFLSVDLDEDAPLPKWAAPVVMATPASLSRTEVADAMDIDPQEPQEQDPLNLERKPPASE